LEIGRPDRGSSSFASAIRFPLVALLPGSAGDAGGGGGGLQDAPRTEDNGPAFRRRSVLVARSWGYVLVAQGRRARIAAVPGIHIPCRARLE